MPNCGAALIPTRSSYRRPKGAFRPNEPLPFNLPADGSLSERTVRLTLRNILTLASEPVCNPPKTGLQLIVGEPTTRSDSPEAYRLVIDETGIRIVGRTGVGVLQGLRTLAQLASDDDLPHGEIIDWPDFSLRGSHLCYHLVRGSLAYNTPNFEALIEQIDRLASVKVNAVLLELESMFPFTRHPKVTCDIAFTRSQIRQLRDRLRDHHIEIIPLVQCLGHAYNVLTHEAYAEYRELPDKIQQYCPTNPEVADLYMDFVADYLEVFPEIRQWHMGGDESRLLARCERCKAKADEFGVSRLYVDHVDRIAGGLPPKASRPCFGAICSSVLPKQWTSCRNRSKSSTGITTCPAGLVATQLACSSTSSFR